MEIQSITTDPILGFQDEYRFLSNFWKVKIFLPEEEYPYPTLENAYQASKTLDPALRIMIRNIDFPGEAKAFGQTMETRPDWNDTMRIRTMRVLLFQKFGPLNPELREKLSATGNRELVETNDWGDHFFGKCGGIGANHLGRLLMEVRKVNLLSEKEAIKYFLEENVPSKDIAQILGLSLEELQSKKRDYDLLYTNPNGSPTQSADWDDVSSFTEQNPGKKIGGFPFSVRWPKMYGGQQYEIITVSGEKYIARVDDAREGSCEGLEWKTVGKNACGNKEQAFVAAWRLIPKQ